MRILYVARSARLARWASDVGLGKHLYKVGVFEGDPKALALAGWAGESDWKILAKEAVDGLGEEEALARLGQREMAVEPRFYPKLKEAAGVFRVAPQHVENHILVTRALAGEGERGELKLKPSDFAAYLMRFAKG